MACVILDKYAMRRATWDSEVLPEAGGKEGERVSVFTRYASIQVRWKCASSSYRKMPLLRLCACKVYTVLSRHWLCETCCVHQVILYSALCSLVLVRENDVITIGVM